MGVGGMVRGDIPYVSLIAIAAAAVVFANTIDLTIISSFASSTFLLIFASINLSAFRLRGTIGIHPAPPLLAMIACLGSWIALLSYLYGTTVSGLAWIGGAYSAIALAEFAFSERRLILRRR